MSEDMRQPIAVKGVVFEPVQGLPREWAFGEVALVRSEERRTPLWEAQIRAHSTSAPRAWGGNPRRRAREPVVGVSPGHQGPHGYTRPRRGVAGQLPAYLGVLHMPLHPGEEGDV